MKKNNLAGLTILIILFLPTVAFASGFRDFLGTVLGGIAGVICLIIGWIVFPFTLSFVRLVIKSPLELFVSRLVTAGGAAVLGFFLVFNLIAGHDPGEKPRDITKPTQTATQTAQAIDTENINQNAEDTVRAFYNMISQGRYGEAYDGLFSKNRKTKITRASFINDFRNTISVTLLKCEKTMLSGSTSKVSAKIRSIDRSERGGSEIETIFQDEWTLVQSNGRWYLDKNHKKQILISGGGAEENQISEGSPATKKEPVEQFQEQGATQNGIEAQKQAKPSLKTTGQESNNQLKPFEAEDIQ